MLSIIWYINVMAHKHYMKLQGDSKFQQQYETKCHMLNMIVWYIIVVWCQLQWLQEYGTKFWKYIEMASYFGVTTIWCEVTKWYNNVVWVNVSIFSWFNNVHYAKLSTCEIVKSVYSISSLEGFGFLLLHGQCFSVSVGHLYPFVCMVLMV